VKAGADVSQRDSHRKQAIDYASEEIKPLLASRPGDRAESLTPSDQKSETPKHQ